MAKIEDVARMAGVSPASVSRYLNNRELLRDETADKIRVAIEKLNYSPNPVAVGLRTGHSKMVAFIIPTMNNLYYIELFNDMHHRCTECGYTLCLYSVEDDLELLKKIISELSEFQYEGAIVSYLDEPEVMKEIQNLRRRMPVVLISANDMRTDFDMVYLDVCEATCSAARHYIQKNYQNIAFIGGGAPKAPRIIIKKKLAGYLKAMEEVGRQPLLGTSEESMTEELADGMTAGRSKPLDAGDRGYFGRAELGPGRTQTGCDYLQPGYYRHRSKPVSQREWISHTGGCRGGWIFRYYTGQYL